MGHCTAHSDRGARRFLIHLHDTPKYSLISPVDFSRESMTYTANWEILKLVVLMKGSRTSTSLVGHPERLLGEARVTESLEISGQSKMQEI